MFVELKMWICLFSIWVQRLWRNCEELNQRKSRFRSWRKSAEIRGALRISPCQFPIEVFDFTIHWLMWELLYYFIFINTVIHRKTWLLILFLFLSILGGNLWARNTQYPLCLSGCGWPHTLRLYYQRSRESHSLLPCILRANYGKCFSILDKLSRISFRIANFLLNTIRIDNRIAVVFSKEY